MVVLPNLYRDPFQIREVRVFGRDHWLFKRGGQRVSLKGVLTLKGSDEESFALRLPVLRCRESLAETDEAARPMTRACHVRAESCPHRTLSSDCEIGTSVGI